MHYYFLFRKIIFSLLVLTGLGVIILLVRFYWGSPEEPPVTQIPIQSPAQQETGGASSLLGNKLDFLKTEEPATKNNPEPPGPAEDSEKRLSAALSTKTEPKPTVPPPPIEKKPAPPAPKPEIKPSTSSSPKEVKKENRLAELKKEEKPMDSVKKVKTAPPDSKKSESNNDIQQPDQKTVTVKAGDSLYTIAEETYRVSNTSVVDRIMALNPKIANPDQLTANQKIRLPEITEESLIIPGSDTAFMIRLGTFMKPEYAHFLKGHPVLQGKEIEIVPWNTPSGRVFYRAAAGKFDSREEGLQVIRDLKKMGLSPYFEGFKKKNQN
jgi:nucleoid-associated protein YgaU